MRLYLLLLVLAACKRPVPSPAAVDASAPPEEPPPPATWKRVTFESERGGTHELTGAIDVFPDGRVVFRGGRFDVPTVARAPNSLLLAIEPWTKTPLPPGPDAGAEYAVRVRVEAAATYEALYPYDHVPPSVDAIYRPANALINSPRRPLPCAKWDGKGAFSLSLQAQDFGVVPGPVDRVTIESDGTAKHATASGAANAALAVVKTTPVSSAELDAIRAAIVGQDLGHYAEVFGGAGEGSNFRSVELATTGGDCARAFTNAYPREMKPLLDAVAPIRARL